MSLRTRLALVSLLVLGLPLAGWQLVLSLERSLRESYQQTLVDTASAMARELMAGAQNLPRSGGLYVHQAVHAPVIDGHAGDWSGWQNDSRALPPAEEAGSPAAVTAAEHRGRLYLLLRVDDTELALPGATNQTGDHVILTAASGERSGSVTIAPAAPGWLEARGASGWPTVRAAMQPVETGWVMEVAFDDPLRPDSLEITIADVDEGRESITGVRGTTGNLPLIARDPALQARLAALLPERTRGWVVNTDGWVLAEAGERDFPNPADGPKPGFGQAAADLAVSLLGLMPVRPAHERSDAARLEGEELGDSPAASWHRRARTYGFVISAAAPLSVDQRVAGHLVIERPADRFMTRAWLALLQLFVFGLLGMILIAAVLIGFAGRLSGRIRRLRDQAEAVAGTDGQLESSMEVPRGSDEIAELGRSLAELIGRQREHQDYLKTLAGKLSHELRTPLAMIRSSLDNLAEVDDPQESERFRRRAEEGCMRLQHMFQAMSQATRIEHSLEDEPLTDLDLGALVSAYVEGCRETFADHRFAAVVPTRPARVRGAPEQIGQLLDKLVANAVDFTPAGARITLRVAPRGKRSVLQVDNPGPGLPARLQDRLFDSMVSSRPNNRGGAHLGLGLHVVRLIARRHGAGVRALDRPGGVRFEVDFPRAGRRGDQALR